ncbi:MAG: hypothetical protein E7580_04445 [Ruminococcaceae bacterium]|nr:hypothetical protein [Oscillospiraceae bacterium]
MANNGNEFLPNYVEHLVPLQEKKYVTPKKLGIIALAIVLTLGVIAATILSNLQLLGGLIFFLLLGIAVLVWYLWRFVSIEYEYTILGGEISFEAIYGRRQRKPYYSAQLKRIEKLAPVGGKFVSKADFQGVTREVFCAAKMNNPKTWYAIVKEENGDKTLLFFEVTEKAEKALRFYNGRAFFG